MAGEQSQGPRRCPFCGGPVSRKDAQFRPFCSERCKLQDLGMWVSGRYAIPATSAEGTPEGEDGGAEGETEEDEGP